MGGSKCKLILKNRINLCTQREEALARFLPFFIITPFVDMRQVFQKSTLL